MIEAYPLYWPEGRKRLTTCERSEARFDTTFARARDNIVREVQLLVGKDSKLDVIISTNIPLRRDGLPLANRAKIDDPGVAVYFTYKKRQMCFACDRWISIADNMQAICKTIEALRGVARWGTGYMMEAAFVGFVALPAPAAKKTWREVLGFNTGQVVTRDQARERYRSLASLNHPDRPGGSDAAMSELNAAWQDAQDALK